MGRCRVGMRSAVNSHARPYQTFSERGDLAHLALLLWALSASALAWFGLRELAAASNFDDFVRELARFNEHFGGH